MAQFDKRCIVQLNAIEAFQIQKNMLPLEGSPTYQGVFFLKSGKMVYTDEYNEEAIILARYERMVMGDSQGQDPDLD